MVQLPGSPQRSPLHFDIGPGWIVAFVALVFVHIELHEIAHTAVGRTICGEWGPRDFNSWQTACSPIPEIVLAPLAGLVFSYGLMWLGYALLAPDNASERRSIGFCLVFGALPLGRVYTVGVLGGGDEMVILTGAVPSVERSLLTAVGLVVVLLLVGPPLYRAFATLSNRRRGVIFVALILFPYVLFEVGIRGIANPLLARGVLDSEGLLGSPLLVNVWTAFWVITLAASWRFLPSTLHEP